MPGNFIKTDLKIQPTSESARNGKIQIFHKDKILLETDGLGDLICKDGYIDKIKVSNFARNENCISVKGESETLSCEVEILNRDVFWEFKYVVSSYARDYLSGRINVIFKVINCSNPRWLVPGILYKHNNPGKALRKFPKFSIDVDMENFISNYWAFSSRRCSMPAVFCWADEFMCSIVVDVEFSAGESGLYLFGNGSETKLGCIFPYCEEPISYAPFRGNEPVYKNFEIRRGEKIEFKFKLFICSSDLHSYDEVVRLYYYSLKNSNFPKPWFPLEHGAKLSAYGLFKWHYDQKNNVIYETRGFDNVLSLNVNDADTRKHMHISWVSGIPYAFALMKYGHLFDKWDYFIAGKNVINKIVSEGVSPAGIFWSQWTIEDGWTDGWNPEKNLTQARTLGEAILFLCRAYKFVSKISNQNLNSIEVEKWKNCIVQNLNFALKVQNSDGNFGSYYDSKTGEVKIWDGCAGLIWIPALIEAFEIFGDRKYKDSAIKAGEYYSQFVYDEFLYGAPEDAYMIPTSEDTYNALIAYVKLYEIDKNNFWLELAKRSADLMMTFRFSHNLKFKEGTILNLYDFRTLGGDIASPVNQHLHNYGLICLPEILKLYKYTGDGYYLDRAIDNILFSLQFIGRFDGDFNAFKGMMPEQFYYVDWLRPEGTILTLSHAWCLGMVIYAYLSCLESEFKNLIFEKIKVQEK
jgi:hypothetical protein